MKIFPLLFCLVLFSAFAAFAQTNKDSSCPSIDISGGGIAEPGETVWFTANIGGKDDNLQIEYVWIISSGKIVAGQGTSTIGVNPLPNQNLTVTLEVKGFPEGCPNTDSDTLTCGLKRPESMKIGEITALDAEAEKSLLERLKNELRTPFVRIYVIVKFVPNTAQETVRLRERGVGKFLMEQLKVEADRITIVRYTDKRESTEIWIVPPGADNPEIKN